MKYTQEQLYMLRANSSIVVQNLLDDIAERDKIIEKFIDSVENFKRPEVWEWAETKEIDLRVLYPLKKILESKSTP